MSEPTGINIQRVKTSNRGVKTAKGHHNSYDLFVGGKFIDRFESKQKATEIGRQIVRQQRYADFELLRDRKSKSQQPPGGESA